MGAPGVGPQRVPPVAGALSRVLALVPDLLFGSKVQAMLEAAGHDVELAGSETDVWDQIAGSKILVVDLTSDEVDGVARTVADDEAAGLGPRSRERVAELLVRAKAAGLAVREEMGTDCCYANQDKFWVTDPDGIEWVIVGGESAVSSVAIRRAGSGSRRTT